ncbi:class I SAM-dependent methyltransferase [Tepidiforma sp.]|uniref:class I SAM-dependent methyltransferase n=1 Tax=Tepidiforma sp. TaxID=2682230 RepID=UPI002ADDC869|nr:class I SAM-dependent methyltransferase [Tepidiforma sp.]
MRLQEMPKDVAERTALEAARHPAAAPGVELPAWYFRRWHFLPEGYLSRRSTALYDRLIRPVYWFGSEGRAARLLTAWLARTRAQRVLEVGAGPGRLLAAVLKRLPGIEGHAIDLSPWFVEMARRRLPGGTVEHADLAGYAARGEQFDAVIATHVLGHLPRSEQPAAAAALGQLVAPGGSLLLIEHRWHRLPPDGMFGQGPKATRGLGFARLLVFRQREEGGHQ